MIKYKVFARKLDDGTVVENPDQLLFDSFADAKQNGREFVLRMQEDTSTGWTWHIEELEY